jgi:hypothetical protein
MFKVLARLALLTLALGSNSLASTAEPNDFAALVAGKQIYGKGIHSQCLPYALGLAQVLQDRYHINSIGIVYKWTVAGIPSKTGQHIVVQYTTVESGVTKRWITDNETKYPILIQGNNPSEWISAFGYNGSFTIDRILNLPLKEMSDREYVGGALMAGSLR